MKKLVVLCAVLALLYTHAAHATVFVWKDPIYNIKLTFPDNWMRQANTDDDLRLFILGPQGSDHAACRVYVHADGRFLDVPSSGLQTISNYVWSADNVRLEYVRRLDTDAVRVTSFNAGGMLGLGAATYTELDFTKRWMDGTVPMHALVAATQYGGRGILIGCEATTTGWGVWQPVFRNIIGSLSFPRFHGGMPAQPVMQNVSMTGPAATPRPIVSRQQERQIAPAPVADTSCPPCNCKCVCSR